MSRLAGTLCVVLTLAAAIACAPGEAPAPDLSAAAPADDRIRPVPFTDVTLQDDFWQPRFERNREVTIPHIMEENEATGRVDNF
ncbi:MAG: hypothetical protein PVJ49_20580, partial [Acidobacteriota bacterium]